MWLRLNNLEPWPFSSFKVWFHFAVVTAEKLNNELCFGLFFFILFLYFWKDNKSSVIKKYSVLWNFFLMGYISYNSSTNSEIQVASKSFPVGWAYWTLVQNTTTNTYLTKATISWNVVHHHPRALKIKQASTICAHGLCTYS